MAIDLKNEVRPRLDDKTVDIVHGLNKRSRYQLNNGVYTIKRFQIDQEDLQRHPALLPQFKEGMTWFEYRLWQDQSVDARVGRFVYDDQHPLIFSRDQLPKPVLDREPSRKEVVPVDINMGAKIIRFYMDLLPTICKPGENPDKYGETASEDSSNLRCLYERICGLGPYVAQSKIDQDVSLLYENLSDKLLRDRLRDPEREQRVIDKSIKINLENVAIGQIIDTNYQPLVTQAIIERVFREIIEITLDVEIVYIKYVQEQKGIDFKLTTGAWGQEPRKLGNGSKGWVA